MSERRGSQRVPVDFWVREERGDFYFLYRCTDISESGMFLAGRRLDRKSLQASGDSKFYIPLPEFNEVVILRGQTAWQRNPHDLDQPSGSAITFSFAPLKFLHAIRRIQKKFDGENLVTINESP